MNIPSTGRQRTIGFADRQMVKLRLCYDIGVTGGAGITNETYYIIPSLASGPLSAGGISSLAQPLSWPQWSALYNAYVVKAASLKLRVVQNTGAVPSIVTLYATSTTPDVLTPATSTVLASQPYSKQRLMGTQAGGHDVVTLKHYISTQKILGLDYLDLALFSGGTSGLPAPQSVWYFGINVQTLDGVSDVECLVFVDLVLYTEFYDRFDTQLV